MENNMMAAAHMQQYKMYGLDGNGSGASANK